jgi:hypothetical protein
MTLAKQFTTCPCCKEVIASGATRCKHCQADLTKADDSKQKSRFAAYNTFRMGFLTGVIFTIVLAILAWFQFRSE